MLAALAVLGASLVGVAPHASAATISTAITKLADGSAPFEDWAPGDTMDSGPTGDSIHQPGDDLNANNNIVRTLDTTYFRVEYAVSPPLPSADLTLTSTLSGGVGWDEKWAPGASTCPSGSTFSADRSTWTCRLGSVSGSSTTVAIDLPAVAAADVPNGTEFFATTTLTEAGGATETATTSATPVTVSSAPRYEVFKERTGSVSSHSVQRGTGAYSDEYGFSANWRVGVRAADPDPRGLSALAGDLTLTDSISGPAIYTVRDCGSIYGYSTYPSASLSTSVNRDQYLSHSGADCSQPAAGQPFTITWDDIDWGRSAAPPTHSPIGNTTLSGYALGLVAIAYVRTWVPVSEVDAANGTLGDGIGTLVYSNAVELEDVDSTPTAGTCDAGYNWTPDGTSPFAPLSFDGQQNLGGAAEREADNGACMYMTMSLNPGAAKGGYWTRGSGVAVDQTFQSYQYISNGSSTVPLDAGAVACDKWDNHRFVIESPATSSFSDLSYEYGIGAWGASYPGGGGTNDANAWYVQAYSDCSDATASPIGGGGGPLWVTADQVDWDNTSAAGTIVNAEDLNMSRATTTDALSPGANAFIYYTWRALDGPGATQLRNYAAEYLLPSRGWQTSTCTGVNAGAETCLVPLQYGASNGNDAYWWQLVDGMAWTNKRLVTNQLYNAGDPIDWSIQVHSVPARNTPPGGFDATWDGAGTTDVVFKDVLPAGLSYQAGSAAATWIDGPNTGSPYALGEPTILANTPSAGFTTLQWNLGPIEWGSSLAVTLTTDTDLFLDTGTYRNYSEVNTPSDAAMPLPNFPSNDSQSRRAFADAQIVKLTRAIISKHSTTPYIVAGDDAAYELRVANSSSENIEYMDAIDLLPHGADGRGTIETPGTFALKNMTTAYSHTEFWVSGEDPETLDNYDGANDDFIDPRHASIDVLGSAQWPCTVAQAVAGGVAGCPDLDDVTAVRIIGNDPNPGAEGGANSYLPAGGAGFSMTMTFSTTTDAQVGDRWENSWLASFEGLQLPVFYNATVVPQIPPLGIGDMVWADTDDDGAYTAGVDRPIGDVLVEVYAVGDTPGVDAPAGQATTGSDGRWFVGDLSGGDYFVYLPASNFEPGAPLEGRGVANNAVADPNANPGNESVDHNTIAAGGVVTNTVTLELGTEPTGDGTPNGYRDEDVNNTIDLAFTSASGIVINKTVYAGHDAGAGCPGVERVSAPLRTEVTYCFAVTNTGDTHLAPVTIDDDDLSIDESDMTLLSGSLSSLAPGATATLAYETTITEDLLNTAETSGNPATPSGIDLPGEDDVTDSDTAEVVDVSVGIGNTMFSDLNNNGIHDSGEPGIAGVDVEVWLDDGDGVFDPTADGGATGDVLAGVDTSDAQGEYYIDGLAAGDYWVVVPSSNFDVAATLSGYQSSTGAATANSDVVADDGTEGDGRDDGVDPSLPGAAVVSNGAVSLTVGDEATGEAGANPPSTLSDDSLNSLVDFGFYQPYDVSLLKQVVAVNGVPVTPAANASVSVGDEVTFRVAVGALALHPQTGGPLADATDVVVRDVPTAGLTYVSDTVGGDFADAMWTAGDIAAGGVVSADVTYKVSIALGQRNFVEVDSTTNPVPDLDSTPGNDNGALTPSEDDESASALAVSSVAVGNTVFDDSNNNGIMDGGEVGIANVLVEAWLDDGDGVFDPTTDSGLSGDVKIGGDTTDVDGSYYIVGMPPGSYWVVVPSSNFDDAADPLYGMISSTGSADPNSDVVIDDGTQGDQRDDGADPANPLDAVVTNGLVVLTIGGEPAGEHALNGPAKINDRNSNWLVDFGFQTTAAIGNLVWSDANANGAQDSGESGVAGVEVTLLDASGAAVATVLTANGTSDDLDGDGDIDPVGFYYFGGLSAGDYQLEFTPPAGAEFTTPNAGGVTGAENSDADADTGRTVLTTLDPGEYDDTWDAGLILGAALGDYVWLDLNGNGVQDAGEPGVAGIDVTLLNEAGDVVATTTTDSSGMYLFEVPPGTYEVVFAIGNDYEVVDPSQGAGDIDSDIDPITLSTGPVTLAPGERNLDLDVGLIRLSFDLALTKSLGEFDESTGLATWRISVSNEGSAVAPGAIIVTDELPPELTFVEADGDGWSCEAAGSTLTCSNPADLAAGDDLPDLLVMTTVADDATDVTNVARVRSESDENPEVTMDNNVGGDQVSREAPDTPSARNEAPLPNRPLAVTGAESGDLVTFAGTLLFIGVIAVATSRRRVRRN